MIRCQCGKVVFDGVVLKSRVAQFGSGAFNVKCGCCKMWLNGLPIGLLTGEVHTDIDFSKTTKEVHYNDTEGAYRKHSQGGV